MVWKSSTKLGCAVVGEFVTCRYSPPGNFNSVSQYVDNVKELIDP